MIYARHSAHQAITFAPVVISLFHMPTPDSPVKVPVTLTVVRLLNGGFEGSNTPLGHVRSGHAFHRLVPARRNKLSDPRWR
jgi:hypothetical protein